MLQSARKVRLARVTGIPTYCAAIIMASFPGSIYTRPHITADLNLVPVYSPPPPPPPALPPATSAIPGYLVPPYLAQPTPAPAPVAAPSPIIVEPIIPAPVMTQYLEAQTAYADAIALRDSVPTGIANSEDFTSEARANLIQAEQAISQEIVDHVLIESAFTAPTLERDLYGEAQANLLATPLPDEATEQAFTELATSAIAEARTTAPTSVNEAGWQRNAAIWDAQDADYALAEADAALAELPTSIPDAARNAAQQELTQARVRADSAWLAVESAFATEYQIVERQTRPDSDINDYVAAHRAAILNEPFDPIYANRIHLAAQVSPAPDPIPPLTDSQLAAAVDPYAERVEQAYRDGGNGAALDEIQAVRAEIAADPAISPAGEQTPLLVQGDRLLILTDELETRLQPTYQQIREGAADHLTEVATDAEHLQVSSAVSAELVRYVEVLPSDQIVPLMDETQHIWEPLITTTYRDEVGYNGFYSNDERNLTANFARITDSLVLVDDGYETVQDIGAAFAQIWAPPTTEPRPLLDFGYMNIPDSFRSVLHEGSGYYLALETVSTLNQTNEFQAGRFMSVIEDQLENYTEDARERISDQIEHRETYYRIIQDFSAINALPAGRSYEPGALPLGEMELQNALAEYIETDPDFLTRDIELTEAIGQDGQRLFHAQMAFEMLNEQTARLDGAQESIDRLGQIWGADPSEGGLSPMYLGSVQLLSDMNALLGQADAADQLADPVGAVNSVLSPAQTLHGIIKRASVGSLPRLESWLSLAGVGSFLISANTNHTTALDGEASGLERGIAGLQSGRYSVQAARDSWMLISRLSASQGMEDSYKLFSETHPRLFNTLTNRVHQLGVVLDAANLIRVGVDIQASGESHFSPDSLFQYGIAANTLTANGLLLGATMYGSGATTLGGSTATAFFTGPAMPIALFLIAGGALASYQYNRVTAANRFETAEMRQALSHIGSLNEDGSLRTIGEVSSFQDHGPRIQVWHPGLSLDGNIDYRGLSANAVDELLNNSSDPESPESSFETLSALAARHNMTGRELLLNWFDNDALNDSLTDEEQKQLPPATFGVDLSATGISDESLRRVWHAETMGYSWFESIQASGLGSDEAFEDAQALIDYIFENNLVVAGESDSMNAWSMPYQEFDLDKVRAILGEADLQPGQAPVPPAVRRAAEQFMAGHRIQSSFRPDSLDGLDLWLQVNGYPAIEERPANTLQEPVRPEIPEVAFLETNPVPDSGQPEQPEQADEPTAQDILIPSVDSPPDQSDLPPLATPEVEPGAAPETDSQPSVRAYTVRAGDTLWSIANQHDVLQNVAELIQFHNQQISDESSRAPRFDPDSIDGSWPSGAANAAIRDPDLIHPGDIIYLPVR